MAYGGCRNVRAAQSMRPHWITRRVTTARWYAIAATTCPGTPLDRMDRRSLCQRGDGGYINNASVNREGINQSDVERVVRVRRRLLAAQQQLLDALVRQAEVLHRVRVLHEQLEQLAVARRQAHPAAALVVTI